MDSCHYIVFFFLDLFLIKLEFFLRVRVLFDGCVWEWLGDAEVFWAAPFWLDGGCGEPVGLGGSVLGEDFLEVLNCFFEFGGMEEREGGDGHLGDMACS